MKISIIIPVYNEEKYIEKTLVHLQPQKEWIDEILVIDGGSTDKTIEIAKPLATLYSSPKGRARQMNLGVDKAGGEILLFHHADSLISPKSIPEIEKLLMDSSIVGGGFSVQLDSKEWIYRLMSQIINVRTYLTRIPYGENGIFVRKEIFNQLNGFKEIPLFEEIDFMRRMKKMGKVRIINTPTLVSIRRWQKEGIIKTTLRNWWLTLRYLTGGSPEKLKHYYPDIR